MYKIKVLVVKTVLTSIASCPNDFTAPCVSVSSLILITDSILNRHTDSVHSESLEAREGVVDHSILFDVRPGIMLNEGLVICRVEYVVVEILSSSDLWSVPPDSDGSSSCSP